MPNCPGDALAATIRDVARRARVSVATVSRAFTQPSLLSPATLVRVRNAAQALAYQPNKAARSLITGKTGALGIIVPDLANPFYPGVLRGVQARAHQSGYAVLLADSEERPIDERALALTMQKQVDGIIICAPFAVDAQLKQLAAAVPLVLVNRRCGDIPAVSMAAGDGMRQVAEHLHALGHTRIAYLAGPDASWSNRQRTRGLASACRRCGIELIALGPFEPKFEGGIDGTEQALEAGVSAIVSFNDLMAMGVLSRLAARGVRVPQDMSVVGFDDVMFASMCAPPLTTVAMPMEAAGRAAVELLLAHHIERVGDGERGRQRELPTRLVIRSTTTVPSTSGLRPAPTRTGQAGTLSSTRATASSASR
jgi:DNA-binding LacI/PurR family transcriptional regulator